MFESVEESAIRLLRESAEPVVSLAWLQRELSDRTGYATHADELESRLRQRNDAVLVLGAGLSSTVASLPADLRETLDRALAGSGIEPGPHVVLLRASTDAPGDDFLTHGVGDDVGEMLRASIATLCRCLADVPAVHYDLLQAAIDLRDLARRIGGAQRSSIRLPIGMDGGSEPDAGDDARPARRKS